MLNWNCSRAELETMAQIAKRAEAMAKAYGVPFKYQTCLMDLNATHCNGNPLDLAALVKADAFNFSHDVFGIMRHIDRETGRLGDCFVPRLSKRDQPATLQISPL